jgi:hypothetical protein
MGEIMSICYACGCKLTSDNETKEHIFIQAIGGRLYSKNLLCKQCNSEFGNIIDSSLAEQLNFISNMLNIKRDRGRPPAFEVEDAKTGEPLLCMPGGKLEYLKPMIKKDGNKYSVRVNNAKEAKAVIKGLKRKHPELNEEEILKTLKNNEEYLDHEVSFEIVFGTGDVFRSICKTAINFYLFSNGKLDDVKHLIPYIKRKEDRKDIVLWSILSDDPIECDASDISHNIIIVGDRNEEILFCYIEFFGVYRVIVVLNNQYKGAAFKVSYFFDVILRQEIKRNWSLSLSRLELEQMIYAPLPKDTIKRQLMMLMEKIQKKQSHDHLAILLERAMNNFKEKCLANTLSEEEQYEELINETMKQLTPWYLHVLRNQRKEDEQL